MQKGSNIGRGQWIHQVMACALYILLSRAYATYKDHIEDENLPLSYDEWIEQATHAYQQFYYWNKTMHLQLLLLKFLQSQREAKYELYKESLGQIVP